MKVFKMISAVGFNQVRSLVPALQAVDPIPSATVQVVNLAYPNYVQQLAGFGMLFPTAVDFDENPERTLGVVFDTDAQPFLDFKSPHMKYTVMMGGHYFSEEGAVIPSDEQAQLNAQLTLARAMGIGEMPLAAQVHTQRDCIPQYVLGHRDKLRKIEHITDRDLQGRLGFIGSSYSGVGVNDVLFEAREAAWSIAREGRLRPLQGTEHL
jgi:oxygen-dependent protoporphyrinogen oxidase